MRTLDPRRAQPAFTGQQLIAAPGKRADEHGLEHAVRANGVSEFFQLGGAEGAARLIGVRHHQVERQLVKCLLLAHVREDGREAPADAALNHGR